jgi:hypothetical protein
MVRIEKEGLKTSISICNQLLHPGLTEGEGKEISGGKEAQKERHRDLPSFHLFLALGLYLWRPSAHIPL